MHERTLQLRVFKLSTGDTTYAVWDSAETTELVPFKYRLRRGFVGVIVQKEVERIVGISYRNEGWSVTYYKPIPADRFNLIVDDAEREWEEFVIAETEAMKTAKVCSKCGVSIPPGLAMSGDFGTVCPNCYD